MKQTEEFDIGEAIRIADEIGIDPYLYRVLIHLIFCTAKGVAPTIENIQTTTRISERKIRSCIRQLEERAMIQTNPLPIGPMRIRNFYTIQTPTAWR